MKQRENGKYVAQINYNSKRIHLGTFEKIEDAIQARLLAEKEYGYIGE